MGKKTSKSHRTNTVFGIVNIIFLLINIILSIWTTNKSVEVAEKSGAFDKAKMELQIGKFSILNDGSDIEVIYGCNYDSTKVFLTYFPIGIKNSGNKDLEEPNLTIRYPHIGSIANMDTLLTYETDFFNDSFKRETKLFKPFDLVSFSLNKLNPNNTIYFNDVIRISPTILNTTFHEPLDSLKTYNVSMIYSFKSDVVLTAKNMSSQIFNFELGVRKANDIVELANLIIREKQKKIDEEGGNPQFNAILIYPSKIKTHDFGAELLEMTETEHSDVKLLTVNLEDKVALLLNSNGQVYKNIRI